MHRISESNEAPAGQTHQGNPRALPRTEASRTRKGKGAGRFIHLRRATGSTACRWRGADTAERTELRREQVAEFRARRIEPRLFVQGALEPGLPSLHQPLQLPARDGSCEPPSLSVKRARWRPVALDELNAAGAPFSVLRHGTKLTITFGDRIS